MATWRRSRSRSGRRGATASSWPPCSPSPWRNPDRPLRTARRGGLHHAPGSLPPGALPRAPRPARRLGRSADRGGAEPLDPVAQDVAPGGCCRLPSPLQPAVNRAHPLSPATLPWRPGGPAARRPGGPGALAAAPPLPLSASASGQRPAASDVSLLSLPLPPALPARSTGCVPPTATADPILHLWPTRSAPRPGAAPRGPASPLAVVCCLCCPVAYRPPSAAHRHRRRGKFSSLLCFDCELE